MTRYTNKKNLVQLQKEVRANGKSIPCKLRGGIQINLVLVISVAKNDCINPTAAFIHPNRPDPLMQVPNATQFQIADTACQYNKDVK